MAIKKEKRTLDAEVVPEQNGFKSGKANKKFKKAKLEKSDDSEKLFVKKGPKLDKPEKNVQGEKVKHENKLAKDQEKSQKQKPEKVKKDKSEADSAETEDAGEKKNKDGQKKVWTIEECKARIEDIKSRTELSRTAKRKLALFRKRVELLEQGIIPGSKSDAEMKKIYAEKRQQRAEKMKETQKKLAANKSKKGEAKVAENGKNKKKGEGKKGKGVEKKLKDEEDSEEEEMEDEEESDAEVEDEAESEESGEKESAEEEEEDDEEDDDEDDDEDEEESEKPVAKKVQQPKAPKAKETKNKVDFKKDNKHTADGEKDGKKTRYVLFVGNLPFNATVDEIKKHFMTKVSEVKDVRLPLKPGTQMSRGIAYVEFANETDYQKGLSLHNSNINGRRIAVEYTQGGSKSAGKKSEIVAKNKKLHAMRKTGKFGPKPDNRNERRKKQTKA